MRGKLVTILVCIAIAIFMFATVMTSYYSATSHSDSKECKNQVYVLDVVDDLAQGAQVLVGSDQSLDPAVQQAFINKYQARHRELVARIHAAGCAVPKRDLLRR